MAGGCDHHHHHHDHGHSHDHHAINLRHSRLIWVLTLTLGYMVVQMLGGFMTGSLALVADSGHMLGDSLSIVIALFANWVNHRPAAKAFTFGYARFEILAALFNGLLLLAVGVTIALKAIERFQTTPEVHGGPMFWFALGGLLVNLIALRLLHDTHHHNLNMKGAYLHVLSDLLGSVSAVVASLLIVNFGWYWADSVMSLIIACLILNGAWELLKSSVNILLEATPEGIDLEGVKTALLNFEGVEEVHELHVWQIDSQKILLTAHLKVLPGSYHANLLSRVQETLKHQFSLSHVTIQLEA